ncbi:uncharacterized protein LOC121053458 [Oryza brachyantha]|uniref:uncharacterized protein LOC121053458 n=1 Tax=Oryza brachyantha TaxID=4533 RepID=UPI001ADAD0DE|nr:uncharacterized protein LOC121053458 [Oryza brachyantha]
MASPSQPLSSDDDARDANAELDQPSHAISAAATPVVVPVAGSTIANVGRSGYSGSGAKACSRPPKPPIKRIATRPKSRLAIAGAPSALTKAIALSAPRTPEASTSVDGLRLFKSMGFTTNSTAGTGCGSSSQQESQSLPPQTESVNDSEPIQIEDDEPEDEAENFGTKRKLTSVVWKDFKRVKVCGDVKAECLHCHKRLGGKSTNGTSHLHDHLKICTLRKIKMGPKTLAQSSLRFNSIKGGKIC